MPVFLYEGYAYNPEDPEEGLFRGAFLVCVSPDRFYCRVLTPMLSIGTRGHPIWLKFCRYEERETR